MVSSYSDSNTRPPFYESALLPLSYACWEHFIIWICMIYITFIKYLMTTYLSDIHCSGHSTFRVHISIYFSTFKVEHTVVNSYQNKLKKIRRKNWEWRLCTLYLLFHVYIYVRKAPKCTLYILSSKLQTSFLCQKSSWKFWNR